MVEKKVLIQNKCGLHLRAAGAFCNTASRYKSRIVFYYGNGKCANAKSVLSVLGAGVKCGDELRIVCDGADEEYAMEELLEVIEKGLGIIL